MRKFSTRIIALAMTAALTIGMTGCAGKKDKEKEKDAKATATAETANDKDAKTTPTPKATAAQAAGKGNNKSDVPLIVGYSFFGQYFNPFEKNSANDQVAVRMTQLNLLTFDREGAVINDGIKGETRSYNDEDYTYYAPANVKIVYHESKKETVYVIKLRDDLEFSDGEAVTIDDVIFTMYGYCDPSYKGNNKLGKQKIKGLANYQKKENVKNISGINRVNDYEVKVTTMGYDPATIEAFDIPICPIHYYGKTKLYRYNKNKFGFEKGKIYQLTTKHDTPIGAGPYQYIKYESGVIYYEANEKYYLGCPQIAFVQLKEIGNITEEEKTKQLQAGEVDIVSMPGSNEAINQITMMNSSGKLNGGTISTRLYDDETYTYIGINANRVNVDGKDDSTRSKLLRTGLAVLLAVDRSDVVENSDQASKVISYPHASTSWVVPQNADEEYEGAFVKDKDGNIIYQSDMTTLNRESAACTTALQFLKKAGYKIKNDKVVDVPEGGSRTFTLLVPKGGSDSVAFFSLADSAKLLFEKIGLTLKVNKTMSAEQIQKKLKNNRQEIWFQQEETSQNGNLYQMYHSKDKADKEAGSRNYFGLSDSDLDDYIEETLSCVRMQRNVKLYTKAFRKIMEWAVEVPFYQNREISIFSSSRINMETVAPDITNYYSWMDEIQSVEMK